MGVTRALYLIDPGTLDVIASYDLPGRAPDPNEPPSNPFQNFSGGAYFYVDHHSRAVIGTADGQFLVIKAKRDSLKLKKSSTSRRGSGPASCSTPGCPAPTGRLWFVTKKNGAVGTLSLRTGTVHVVRLGNGADGEIENSFAVGSHAEAYVATNRRLYRFSHTRRGVPRVVWSVAYPPGGR